jgi:hypothetical protein
MNSHWDDAGRLLREGKVISSADCARGEFAKKPLYRQNGRAKIFGVNRKRAGFEETYVCVEGIGEHRRKS